METVAGVFGSAENARRAARELIDLGFRPERVNLLLPGSSESRIHSIPTSETEQPGVGGAIGGVLGAALGIAGGFELGTAAAAALVPGVGPVMAFGIAGAALLGIGGAAGGAAAGSVADEKSTEGIPADEVFFYEDALRQGRSVVIAFAGNPAEVEQARLALAEQGAESLDAAREAWWLGLRDAEAEHYRAIGHNFEQDQNDYRAGFEAALRRECRDRPSWSTAEYLRCQYPDIWGSAPFRAGYKRGQAYLNERLSGQLSSR
jgi:hypothetical protein